MSSLEFACCGPRRKNLKLLRSNSAHLLADSLRTGQLRERFAMILGMNPKSLRQSIHWNLFMWPKKHHWALVVQPAEDFLVRIVDDFAYSPSHCFSSEVPSARFYLILELLLEGNVFFPLVSVKSDFISDMPNVLPLGLVGPMNLVQMEQHALEVIASYKNYSLIGCNCQHFAADVALALGARHRPAPEDERLAKSAASGANAVGAAGVSVAACAAAGAAGTSVLGLSGLPLGSAMGSASAVLGTVAASASVVGVVGGLTLMGVAQAYEAMRDASRENGPELQNLDGKESEDESTTASGSDS